MATSRIPNITGAATYRIDSPAKEWRVTHNLGYRPNVQTVVKNPDTGVMTVWLAQDVSHPDANTVVVSWSEPRQGEVRFS